MEAKRYIHIEDNKYLKIQVYYDLGGMNYFTGKQESRGYYLSVSPVEKGDGWESFTAFNGIKKCILTVNRKSKKKFEYALGLAEKEEQELINYVKEKNN
jgi:hypothetical protein